MHGSDGLAIRTGGGEAIFRPLANPRETYGDFMLPALGILVIHQLYLIAIAFAVLTTVSAVGGLVGMLGTQADFVVVGEAADGAEAVAQAAALLPDVILLDNMTLDQLRQAVTLLTRAELTFKQDYGSAIWPELESLSLLLCHKALADVFIDG